MPDGEKSQLSWSLSYPFQRYLQWWLCYFYNGNWILLLEKKSKTNEFSEGNGRRKKNRQTISWSQEYGLNTTDWHHSVRAEISASRYIVPNLMEIQETDLSHRQSESYILLQTWLAKNQLSRTNHLVHVGSLSGTTVRGGLDRRLHRSYFVNHQGYCFLSACLSWRSLPASSHEINCIPYTFTSLPSVTQFLRAWRGKNSLGLSVTLFSLLGTVPHSRYTKANGLLKTYKNGTRRAALLEEQWVPSIVSGPFLRYMVVPGVDTGPIYAQQRLAFPSLNVAMHREYVNPQKIKQDIFKC